MPLISKTGRYTATVESAELGQSEKGTPFLALLCKTEQGEELTAFQYMSEAALKGTSDMLIEVFGVYLKNDPTEAELIQSVTGKPCSIVVVEDEYEGKTRLKVKYVNPVGGGRVKPLDNASSVLAQICAKAKRIPAAAPSAASAPRAAARPAPAAAPKAAPAGEDPF